MKNKKTDFFIIIAIAIITIVAMYTIQNKDKYIQSYIKQQLSFFKTPIPFIHKIQYFYDRAIIFYLNNDKKNAIMNLEISQSFIASYNLEEMKKAEYIIQKTIQNIKNNKKFNYFSYQKQLYTTLTSIVHNYYVKSQEMINTLNKYMQKSDETNKMLQIAIFLFAVVAILSYVLYIMKESFKHSSFKDPLTDANNRRCFFEDIKSLPTNHHTLVMADIDHFKQINDIYGHDMGDFVLKEFVKIIRENIRKEDRIYRWGGEEFVILFKNMNVSQAAKKIEEIREKIETYNFNGIKITASFGIKEITGKPSNEDLKIMDNALYISKEKGRNRITVLN